MDGDSALARLILVDVTWSEWEPEKDRESYEKVIKTFLGAPLASCGSSGPVYLHQCYETDNPGGSIWIEQTAAYELPPKDACQYPGRWLGSHEGLQRVTSVPAAEREVPPQFGSAPVHQVRDWGRMFRTRIFMGAELYRSVVKCGGDADYWVLINMHFQRVTQASVLWHTSFSVWSDLPRSSHHCPAHITSPRVRGLSAENSYNFTNDWSEARDAFRDFVHSGQRRSLRVFGRSYQPPSFLVAVPEGRHPGATGDPTENGNDLSVLRQVSNEILWTQNYESLPHALLKGGINAFRRVLPLGEIDTPRYLLIPDVQTRIRNRKDINVWRGIQEDATAVGVRILADLEAYAASELRGIDSRMRIRENHLRIYQGVAEQAGTFWDALARLLPDARGRRLEIIHRSIEMIHQTLL